MEIVVNYVIAFVLAWFTNYFVLPQFGFKVSKGDATWLTIIFTLISIARSYCVRRFFNYLHHK